MNWILWSFLCFPEFLNWSENNRVPPIQPLQPIHLTVSYPAGICIYLFYQASSKQSSVKMPAYCNATLFTWMNFEYLGKWGGEAVRWSVCSRGCEMKGDTLEPLCWSGKCTFLALRLDPRPPAAMETSELCYLCMYCMCVCLLAVM